MSTAPHPFHHQLPASLLWLMATACGVSVANVYYNQPLLGDFATYFHATPSAAGLVSTAAQVGYGVGLLFFLPLGDLVERRRLIVVLVFVCAACLFGLATVPTLPWLIAGHLLVGATAISPQILIPLGTDLAPPEQRGKLIGILMSGLLAGVLLARTLAGAIADHFGWRAVYGVAAGLMLILGLALRAKLPAQSARVKMPYGRLMHSLLELVRSEPALRRMAMVSALSFASFGAFWTTLSFLLSDRFHLGASVAGLFGIVGIVGAAGAPWAGRLTDRRGHSFTLTLALLGTALAFATMSLWVTLPSLVFGVLAMDLGVQAVQVAAQSKVLSLRPEARSRLNTLYMLARMLGGAAGCAAGAMAWEKAHWPGVCALALGLTLLALAALFFPSARS